MATIVSSLASFGVDPFRRAIRKWLTHRNTNPGDQFGLIPFDSGDITVPTTVTDATDTLVLFQFPESITGAVDVQAVWTDMDSGTGTLRFKVGYGLVDGTYQGDLISATTIGTGANAAGSAKSAEPLLGVSVGGKYCLLTVTAAANTPAAGTVRIRGVASMAGRRNLHSPAALQ